MQKELTLETKQPQYHVYSKKMQRVLLYQPRENMTEKEIRAEIKKEINEWKKKFERYYNENELADGYIVIAETNHKKARDIALAEVVEKWGITF